MDFALMLDRVECALHLAMTLDRVECVHLLFECGADPEELYHYPSKQDRHANPSLDGVVIDTAEEPPKKGSAKELEDELKTAASCKEQIKRWSELFKSSKLIKTESHVQAFKTDVKNEWRGWRLFSYKQMFWKNNYTAEDLAEGYTAGSGTYTAEDLAEGYKAGSTTKEKLGIIYDFKRDQVKNTSSSSESAKEKSSNAKSSHANGSKDNNGKDKGSQGSKKKSSNDKGEEDGTEEEAHDDSMDSSEKKKLKDEETQSAKHKMSVLLLLAIYKDVLGDDFKYDLGVLGDCYLDLFFLMVLMNRVEMAKMLWQRAKFPVMSALTACALLRGMAGRSDAEPAGRSDVEPVTRNKMTMSAQEFENMAIGVQAAALHRDIQLADVALDTEIKILEQPRNLWGEFA
ncbi:hypothetical protein T484DRAFT_1803403 [Baffinella frigidus]|nr:hypothetical protein T484DRAFT_1803403 [Cryptophyta sp. CCMP2293]